MKVLILSGGSPNGTTISMCQTFASALPSDWGCEVIDVSGGVAHCRGCDLCRGGTCVIHDEMDHITEAFLASDAVVFATPVRFSGPSSMIKSVIDRFQALWNNPAAYSGKRRAVTYMASGGSPEPSTEACTRVFRAFAAAFGCGWIEPLIVKGTDKGADHSSETGAFAKRFSDSLKDIISADN